MIKLTYTDEMKKQDELWQTEKEDLNTMKKLYNDIIDEAKNNGFQGNVIFHVFNDEAVFEIFESKKEEEMVSSGELDLNGENMGGYCKPLIEKLERILNEINK